MCVFALNWNRTCFVGIMETVSLKEIIFSSFEKMLCWKCSCKLHILKNRTGIVCWERFSLQFSIEMRCCCIVRKIDIAEFYSGCFSILLKFQALWKEIKFFLWGQWVGDSLALAAGGRVQPITWNTLCALQQAGGHPKWCCASCRYKTVAAHTHSLSPLLQDYFHSFLICFRSF